MESGTDTLERRIQRLERRAERERRARMEAEAIAERSTRALYEQQQLLLLMQRTAAASNEAETAEEAFQTTLDLICDLTRWPVGHVYRCSEDPGEQLVPTGIWHLDEPDRFERLRATTAGTVLAPGQGLPGRVYAEGGPVWITDVAHDPGFTRGRVAGALGIHAAFAFPVLVGREVAAVLEFFSTRPVDPDERLLVAMRFVGAQLGRVIERTRAEKALRRRERQLAEAQQIAHLGSWEWDLPSGVLTWSDELCRIYGQPPDRCRLTFDDFLARVHPADHDLLRRTIDGARRTGRAFSLFHRIVRPDGVERIVFSRGEVIAGAGGEALRMIGTAQDVTEARRAEAELEAYAARLEHSNRELEQFAYVASHDLQEPLRKITSFGDRLMTRYGDRLDEQGRGYLERVQDAAGRMSRLITDLLAYSRVATKREPFVPVDLGAVAAEVVSDLEARVEQSKGRVEIGPLPTVEADALQMRQLFQNLIGNGLKFHRPGVPPVVKIYAEGPGTERGGASRVKLYVEDNGIGIDPAHTGKLFVPFQRLHTRDEYEGTGIGLAVCRKIAERHGGSITLRSEPGQGSCFIVTLPAKQPAGGAG